MTRSTLSGIVLIATLGLVPAEVVAQDASPIAAYRQSLMQAFRTHMGGVRAALGDDVPMGHAVLHAESFARMARALGNAFPAGSDGPGSRALPAIWENRSEFMNRVSAIQSATANLVTAAESGDATQVQEALSGVQATCSACHQPFRGPPGQ